MAPAAPPVPTPMPVNFKGQNPGGKVSPMGNGGYAHDVIDNIDNV